MPDSAEQVVGHKLSWRGYAVVSGAGRGLYSYLGFVRLAKLASWANMNLWARFGQCVEEARVVRYSTKRPKRLEKIPVSVYGLMPGLGLWAAVSETGTTIAISPSHYTHLVHLHLIRIHVNIVVCYTVIQHCHLGHAGAYTVHGAS